MNEDNLTKEKILHAARELFHETRNFNKITVRNIAKRAGVGVGLINYHFQTKENLFSLIIGENMKSFVNKMYEGKIDGQNSLERLKTMLKENAAIALKHYWVSKKGVEIEMKGGNKNTIKNLLPVLKKLFPALHDEKQLKLLAYQLLVPLQIALIYPEAIQEELDFDIFNDDERNATIERMVDNIINTFENPGAKL